MNNGIRSLPRYLEGGPTDPDKPMTVRAEGVTIPLDAPQRGLRSQFGTRRLRDLMGGLGGLAAWEMGRDRLARGIENADLGPLRALRVLPEGLRERMANVFDESTLTADDLPENTHDFARMIAAQAIARAGGADLNQGGKGTHMPYPTQEFAAEHYNPGIVDMIMGKVLGVNRDVDSMSRDERNEAMGFTDPSGWGATFGQGRLFEDAEGNIHAIDRFNYPNMTAGQVPGREEDTSRAFSPYAAGKGPHDSEQFRSDIGAFAGEEGEPLSNRALNVMRHYMSEFGSTEDDPTEGRSWDINLGPREELMAAYEAAIADDKPSMLAGARGWLGDLINGGGPDEVQVTEDAQPYDPIAALTAKLGDVYEPDMYRAPPAIPPPVLGSQRKGMPQ